MTISNDVKPAFDRATPMQRRFILAYIVSGGMTTQSIRAAGYSGKGAGTRGTQVLAIPHVREAIRDMALKTLDVEMVVMALTTVHNLSVHAKSESVRLQAAQDILNRAKLAIPEAPERKQPGTVVINFGPPQPDGTHRDLADQREGVERLGNQSSPIPLPRTVEGSYQIVDDPPPEK